MENEGLAGQPGVAVGQKVGGNPEGAAGLTYPGSPNKEILDEAVVEGSMGPVIKVEGALGESPTTEGAAEALDGTDDLGGAETDLSEPVWRHGPPERVGRAV
jgi:hypothetical protein